MPFQRLKYPFSHATHKSGQPTKYFKPSKKNYKIVFLRRFEIFLLLNLISSFNFAVLTFFPLFYDVENSTDIIRINLYKSVQYIIMEIE